MTESEVVRARLVLSYDGTAFSGWATQPGLRTVQGTLEVALGRLLRTDEPPRVTVAGRTDAGVHAAAQVAHVDIPATAWARLQGRGHASPAEGARAGLDALVDGDDLVILQVTEAPPGFDARFGAVWRRYSYRVSDRLATRRPWQRHTALWYPREVDDARLAEASGSLLGLRDFGAFCRPRDGATTIRDLQEFSWERRSGGADDGLLVATVRADAFCHSMVRSLVGAVLAVGDGRRGLDWLEATAASSERSQAISVAAPHGLCLEEVGYPPDAELAARAEATRGRRSLD